MHACANIRKTICTDKCVHRHTHMHTNTHMCGMLKANTGLVQFNGFVERTCTSLNSVSPLDPSPNPLPLVRTVVNALRMTEKTHAGHHKWAGH